MLVFQRFKVLFFISNKPSFIWSISIWSIESSLSSSSFPRHKAQGDPVSIRSFVFYDLLTNSYLFFEFFFNPLKCLISDLRSTDHFNLQAWLRICLIWICFTQTSVTIFQILIWFIFMCSKSSSSIVVFKKICVRS